MSDQGFREIQLGGKQVVFLFLLLAVALVGTFLLGVSAGRGATPVNATVSPIPAPAEPIGDSAPMPPKATPGPMSYPTELLGKDAKAGAPAVTTPTPTVTATPTTVATPSPAPQQIFPGAPPPPASAASKAPAGDAFFVQVNSFSTHDNAVKEVAKLRSLNITGTILNAPGGGAHFKVRVGPLDRTAAEALKARLSKQGYKPSVIPR